MQKVPKWTVIYGIKTKDSPWLGAGWEFFDDEATAQARYDELRAQGCHPTKRPWSNRDKMHLVCPLPIQS